MTTTNTETLTLYANPFLYNGSRYVFYQNGRDYETWLRETSPEVETKTVYFKSLTEEIEINSPVKDITKYTYGKISNCGRFYYIFIDRITTDQHGKSYVTFSVDWWASEWANIHPTKAHLIRKPTKPGYMAQPWTPLNTTYSSDSLGGNLGRKGCIMFTYIPSYGSSGYDNRSYIALGILELTENNLALVQNGYWYQKFKIAGSDIKDCFIVPMLNADDVANRENTLEEIEVNTSEVSGDRFVDKLINSFEQRFQGFNAEDVFQNYRTYVHSLSETSPPLPFTPQNLNIKVYDIATSKWYAIAREDVWVATSPVFVFTSYSELPPYSRPPVGTAHREYRWHYWEVEMDESEYSYKKVDVTSYIEDGVPYFEGYYMSINDEKMDVHEFMVDGLHITTTEQQVMGINDWNGDIIWECPYGMIVNSFRVRLLIGLSHVMLEFIPNGSNKNGSKLTGEGFTYDCRHPGLFVDSYQDYILKNRDYDIAMRQIQSDKQLWHAGISTAENVGFGLAFGQEKGGVAAGIGGLLETAGTFVINKHFDPMIQEQYDVRYNRMTDQISLIGDSVTDVYNERENGLMQLYTLTMDTATQKRMNDDIQVNGYVCDETTPSLEELFTVGAIIQTDMVVVEGACCLDAKQQTVYRLGNGVEFK